MAFKIVNSHYTTMHVFFVFLKQHLKKQIIYMNGILIWNYPIYT